MNCPAQFPRRSRATKSHGGWLAVSLHGPSEVLSLRRQHHDRVRGSGESAKIPAMAAPCTPTAEIKYAPTIYSSAGVPSSRNCWPVCRLRCCVLTWSNTHYPGSRTSWQKRWAGKEVRPRHPAAVWCRSSARSGTARRRSPAWALAVSSSATHRTRDRAPRAQRKTRRPGAADRTSRDREARAENHSHSGRRMYIASGTWDLLGGVAVTMVPGARFAPFASWNSRFRWPHDRGFSSSRQFYVGLCRDRRFHPEIHALTRSAKVQKVLKTHIGEFSLFP